MLLELSFLLLSKVCFSGHQPFYCWNPNNGTMELNGLNRSLMAADKPYEGENNHINQRNNWLTIIIRVPMIQSLSWMNGFLMVTDNPRRYCWKSDKAFISEKATQGRIAEKVTMLPFLKKQSKEVLLKKRQGFHFRKATKVSIAEKAARLPFQKKQQR